MSRLRFGQLSRRLYVAFLVAAVIPTAVAGIIGVYFSLQALRAETTGNLEREVDFRAQGATRFFEQVSSELLFLARDYAAAGGGTGAGGAEALEARIRADFLALARHYPHVYQIRLLDRSGLERIRVDRVGQGTRSTAPELLQNKSDRYYFQEAIRRSPGQLYVSPLDLNVEFGRTETPERPVIRFATTFDSPSGGGRQLLIINLHADVLLGQIQQMADSRDGSALLFDRAGHFMARGATALDITGKDEFSMQPVAGLEHTFGKAGLQQVLAGGGGSVAADGWIVASAPIGAIAGASDSNWILALAYPESRLFQAVVNLYLLYAVLLLSLLVTAVGGWLVSRRLLGPLEALSRETEAIAAGNFATRVRIPGSDEIAALGERFNSMAARLQTLYASLESQRDHLEVEVAARTRDLEAERAFLSQLIENLGEGVLAVSANGTLQLANRQAGALFSLPADCVDRQLDLELAWPAWRDWKARYLDQGVMRGDIADGGKLLDITAARHRDGLVLVARDVLPERQFADERRELDRHMFQMEKLISFGELAMGVAHEIGNPLAGMKAVAQALQYEEDLPPGVSESLARLEAEIDRLAGFLASFRGFSAAAPAPQMRACLLTDAVDDVCFWVRKEAKTAAVRIELVGLADAPPLLADPQQLKQLLLNLFINALHAMPDGGELRCVLDGQREGAVEFHISDNGVGIAAELLAQVFEPFFTTRDTGTGLGLSIVRKIAEAHAASIRIDSTPGVGTTIHLIWPLAEHA